MQECLFQPSLFDIDGIGVHEMVLNSISECEPDIQNDMYSNIVVSGGSSMFEGFVERLKKEIAPLVPSGKFTVVAPQFRQFSTWTGGSILGCLSFFQNMWVTKDEYDEYGPEIVHHLCL